MKILFLILTSSIFSIYGLCDLSKDPQNWYPITDNVMGGVSNLQVTHKDGVFLMQGTVSTKNNGGFVRFGQDVSFKDNSIKGIRFKAKGNNESYEIHVTLKGIKMPPWSYFSNSFSVSEEWQEYEIYFSDFSREGYSARSMQPKNIRNLSFAGYGRDFPVDLAVKDISVIN